jgi:hypothetical protein
MLLRVLLDQVVARQPGTIELSPGQIDNYTVRPKNFHVSRYKDAISRRFTAQSNFRVHQPRLRHAQNRLLHLYLAFLTGFSPERFSVWTAFAVVRGSLKRLRERFVSGTD